MRWRLLNFMDVLRGVTHVHRLRLRISQRKLFSLVTPFVGLLYFNLLRVGSLSSAVLSRVDRS